MAVSNEVWEMARAIYENTPNISLTDLLDRLKEMFGDDAPKSKSTLSRKIKKESWQVKTGIEVVTDEEIKKKNKQAKKKPKQELLPKANDRELQVFEKVKQAEQKIEQELNNLTLTAQQRAEIIVKHRNRLQSLGTYQDYILTLACNISNYDIDSDSEKDGDSIRKILIMSKEMSSTLNQLTSAQKLIAEQEFALCGITADDFTQSEQERRLGALSLLDGIADEEREARHRLKGQLMERLEWIEDLENDPSLGINQD